MMAGYESIYDAPKDDYFSNHDSSFTSGDSPAILSVKSSLSKIGVDGYIICDGAGDIHVKLSSDGVNYGSIIPIKYGDQPFSLKNRIVNKIQIIHTGTDSSYRVFCE